MKLTIATVAVPVFLMGDVSSSYAHGGSFDSPCESGLAGLVQPASPGTNAEIVQLGRRLFFDRRLSVDQSTSCSTCHHPELAFTDGRRFPVGVHGQLGDRNAPSLYNLVYSKHIMWDGRTESLEEQVIIALTNPLEMGITEHLLQQRFRDDSVEFAQLFDQPLTLETIAEAIAAFERTLLLADSPVDRFLYCGELEALTATQKKGLALFSGPANCIRCHWYFHPSVHPFGGSQALFTDNRFHNIGAGDFEEPGRAAVTGRAEDWGAFKTPSLRNVALTAPYMHDGSIATLGEVVEFYNKGGVMKSVDPSLRPLRLSPDEVDAIVEFLRGLTSPTAALEAHRDSAGEGAEH